MSPRALDLDQVLAVLRGRIAARGIYGLAKQLKVSPGYINDVDKGRRAPGPKLLAALGLASVTTYHPTPDTK